MYESITCDDGVTPFEPDADGLHHALSQLIDHRARAGNATPQRRVVDLPVRLPRNGMDPEAALQVPLALGIGQAVRLDHPGYMAHMDPPTPWPTWVTAMMAASVNQNLLHRDQPKESAVVMFADTPAAHSALSFGGSYLAAPNIGVLGSHGAGAAMRLLTTLLILGHHGVAARIDSDMAVAGRLCDLVERHPELELRQRHVSGVVNWRSHGVDPRHVQRELRQAWVSVAQIAGESWLRSVAANPRADVDGIVEEVMAATVRCTDHSV